MKIIYTLFKRNSGYFYMYNKLTRKQSSLKTRDRAEAMKLVQTYNDAANQAYFNQELARIYLAGSDPAFFTRTWQEVMDYMVKHRTGENRRRWSVAMKDKSLNCLRKLKVAETHADDFMKALSSGKPSTNAYLRRVHNFVLGMEWRLSSVLPKALWPAVPHSHKRAITEAEHVAIVAREANTERRAFYELLWHIGASQGDAASLEAENINWTHGTISYSRRKLSGRDQAKIQPAVIRFGEPVAEILRRLPQSGPLFPYLRTVRAGDRATEFGQRCRGLKIYGVTLHSYRYAWAERALRCGYPERFAQAALGHNSKAVHYAYAKSAQVVVPSLDDWEANLASKCLAAVLPLPNPGPSPAP